MTRKTKKDFVISNPHLWVSSESAGEFLKQNKALEDLKFRNVLIGSNTEELPSQDELTLVIRPSDKGSSSLGNSDYLNLREKYPELEQTRIVTSEAYTSGELPITFKIAERTNIMGGYIRRKNIVWIVPQINQMHFLPKGTFQFVIDVLKANMEILKVEEVKIDRMQELCEGFYSQSTIQINQNLERMDRAARNMKEYMETMKSQSGLIVQYQLQNLGLELFAKETTTVRNNVPIMNQVVKEKLDSVTKEIKQIVEQIKQSESIMQDYNKQIREPMKDNILLKELNSDKRTFKRNFQEMGKLPFVKNLRLVQGEIRFRIDDVKLRYDGRTYEMGNFTVHLGPQKIYFTGDKYILNDRQKYYHPHIYDKQCCLGTYLPKMNELKASMKLPELAMLIKQFLNTYTPNDRYMDLSYFTGAQRDYVKYKNSKFENDKEPFVAGVNDGDEEITEYPESETGRNYDGKEDEQDEENNDEEEN